MSSPTHSLIRRGTGLRAVIPLSDETAISTRGQALPSLLQKLSSSPPALSRKDSGAVGDLEDPDGQARHGEGRGRSNRGFHVERRRWDERRVSSSTKTLLTPQMRSQRLIGNSNPRYRWEQYYKTEEQLAKMKKPIRRYYERNNELIQQYIYIDRLLDSSLPHELIQDYSRPKRSQVESGDLRGPLTTEEASQMPSSSAGQSYAATSENNVAAHASVQTNGSLRESKLKRTPRDLYRIPNESTGLLSDIEADETGGHESPAVPLYKADDSPENGARIVKIAIYVNLTANTILLVLKIIVMLLTSSISVLASLVDAALDFLSTAIVWTTTRLVSQKDRYKYPIGRRRLEPVGVLVFSVIMITSFFQVALEGLKQMTSGAHGVVRLSPAANAIMASTVIIKFFCWLWCRLIKNSSVQALAQDAMTDVVFNTFSIIFPLVGYYANVWWLDPLGGIALSFYVIFNWSGTTTIHIRNLTGAAASADERNVLLYLCMRFAWTIKKIQGLEAYHAGDKLNVEVDIVLDENMSLRDTHDLGESLQYMLESVPTVDRAFVHMDYAPDNLPSHMEQQD